MSLFTQNLWNRQIHIDYRLKVDDWLPWTWGGGGGAEWGMTAKRYQTSIRDDKNFWN